ncbi:MAG: hypothetical protein J0I98_06620 [Mesorhizobium sp.]|nr:hypothetical protein [Mesorhizobium sp.]MBN9242448.1 hypothetical protein [Mesorhizobium sp.]
MDAMIPIIRQLHDADGDRARACVLLVMPDSILLKFAGTIGEACQRAGFQAGAEYVLRRVTLMRATRDRQGMIPGALVLDFDTYREAFAAFANGEGRADG